MAPITGLRCINCKEEYSYTDKYICPECGSENADELHNLNCETCNYEFVGTKNEVCPKCESDSIKVK